MMNLDTQIATLISSFLYGMVFSFLVSVNYKYLYHKKILLRILFTFMFIFANVLIYFIILRKINQAILHPYSLGMILVGFCLEHYLHHLVVSRIKRWYTFNKVGDNVAAKKKIPAASKHRLMIFGTLSIVLMGYFWVTLITYTINIKSLKEKEKELKVELSSLKNEASDLSNTIQKLKDPDYIARYARENYYYSANGEYIIKIEDKKLEETEPPKTNNHYKYYIYGSVFCIVGIFLYIVKKK